MVHKLTKVSPKRSASILSNYQKNPTSVNISFKYLYKMTKDFQHLYKYLRKNDRSILDDFQKFLYEASKEENIIDLINNYGSRRGSSFLDKSIPIVKEIIDKFEKEFSEDTGLISDELIHLHLKKGGKGKFLIFGIQFKNIFYVLALDPEYSI